jgi:hypothetical protein
MPSPTWARITIALAALATAVVIVLTGGRLDTGLARAVATASTVVILALLAFDRWLWRWPVIRAIHSTPVLRGTWKTEVRSTYVHRRDEAIEAYLAVAQTYSQLKIRMLFDRSQSESLSATLLPEAGRCTLYYIFRSEKHALEPDSNPPNRGAAQLVIGKRPHAHLEGDYWMEAGTRGRVRSVGFDPMLYDTFAGAQKGTYAS